MRSAARRSPPARPRSASTTPTRVRCGKCQPLATIWVPMMSSTSRSPMARAASAAAAGPGMVSRGHDQAPRLRPENRRLLLDALHAGPDRREAVGRAAFRALGGRRLGVAAVVALQPPLRPVLHQPGGAVRAAHPVAAVAAERQRRVAAAVQEQHRLLAARERLADRLDQHRAEEAPALRRPGAQVDRLDRRQPGPAVALRQAQRGVAPALHVVERLQARRRGNQHAGGAGQPRPHHRHVAGVVDHAVLLLEGGLVLLVHHHEAEVGEGQEQRGAGADHDRRLAFRHRAPGVAPRARADLGMPQRRFHPEARAEPVQPLRRQRDLRQHHQRLPPLPQALGHRVEIHLGLAGTGDAGEQGHPERPRRHLAPQIAGRPGLGFGQGRPGMVRIGAGEAGGARQERPGGAGRYRPSRATRRARPRRPPPAAHRRRPRPAPWRRAPASAPASGAAGCCRPAARASSPA